jgi:GrpB-like predicted nucleotidyltransferase (UPF0157 family)
MIWSGLPVIFLGLAPFLLLPTIFAFVGRKRSRRVILGANLLLIALIIVGILTRGAPFLGVAGSLITWLVLIGISLKRDAPPAQALDESVILVPYDTTWPRTFEAERQRVCDALELSTDAIEHIGSTAVPCMVAKPIIDLMLGVPNYPPVDTVVSRLVILGYQDMGEAGVPHRRYLRLREQPSFNMHIVARDGEHWTNNLRLRNYLRRDAGARERYAAAKQAAIAAGHTQLLAYSKAKQDVLAELVTASR